MTISNPDVARLVVRLDAVRENYRICGKLAASAEVAGVVKADGYGLGMAEVAGALLAEHCETFFVARLSEGLALRPLAPEARIFVLDGVTTESSTALIAQRLIPVLNSVAQFEVWSDAAGKHGASLEAALHIDTGMNRLGLPLSEVPVLADLLLSRANAIDVKLVMSHLACSDDPASAMNRLQLEQFRASLATLPPAPASLSSSGGIMLGKDYAFDVVRPGIALYGGNPQPEYPNPFKSVAVLTGSILQLHRVDKGESVGYAATYRTERPSTLATVALGYADGLMRAMGNRGMGAIAGTRAPFVGRVSMDLVTLDVTDVPASALFPGAEIEFIGDTISLDEFSLSAQTASYETLTSLGARVPRKYLGAS